MEATSPSYLLTRPLFFPRSPSTYLKISTTATHITSVLFFHNHSLAASRPSLYPNFSSSVQEPFCGRLPVSRISS
jgi:hypothetical protein